MRSRKPAVCPPGMSTTQRLADRLGKSAKTLIKWRCLGIGPGYIKIGGTPVYPDDEVEKWLSRRRHRGGR